MTVRQFSSEASAHVDPATRTRRVRGLHLPARPRLCPAGSPRLRQRSSTTPSQTASRSAGNDVVVRAQVPAHPDGQPCIADDRHLLQPGRGLRLSATFSTCPGPFAGLPVRDVDICHLNDSRTCSRTRRRTDVPFAAARRILMVCSNVDGGSVADDRSVDGTDRPARGRSSAASAQWFTMMGGGSPGSTGRGRRERESAWSNQTSWSRRHRSRRTGEAGPGRWRRWPPPAPSASCRTDRPHRSGRPRRTGPTARRPCPHRPVRITGIVATPWPSGQVQPLRPSTWWTSVRSQMGQCGVRTPQVSVRPRPRTVSQEVRGGG